MTIALGILASDGIVIAADSQSTAQGYWKGNQGKIWWAGQYCDLKKSEGRSAGVCGISGASGRVPYLESLAHKLAEAFQDDPDAISPKDAATLFEQEVATFHKKHVAIYTDLPEVRMVIGYHRNHRQALFATDRGTLTDYSSHSFAAVGIGEFEARSLLTGIYKLRLDVRTAIVLAAHAVFTAKEKIDDCGNHTDILYLKDHAAAFVRREAVEEFERVFRRHAEFLQTPLLLRVLGADVSPMLQAGEATEVLRRDIEAVEIQFVEGIREFNPRARLAPQGSKRGLKRQPPSQG